MNESTPSTVAPTNISQLAPGSYSILNTSSAGAVPSTVAPTNISQLAPGSYTSNGQPLTLQQYQTESANPAMQGGNISPSGFSKLMAGTPLSPIQVDETSGNNQGDVLGNGLKLVGSLFANTISDIPAAAGGLLSLLEPWKWPSIVSGLYNGAKNIVGESYGAIKQGVDTGDWSRLGQDVDKAEITIGNHPLQSILAFDGALEGAGTASDALRDSYSAATDPNINFSDTPTGKGLTSIKNNVLNARANIGKLFGSGQSTLDEHTVELGNLSDKFIADTKAYNDQKNIVDSFQKQNADMQTQHAQMLSDLDDLQSKTAEEKELTQSNLDQNLEDVGNEKQSAVDDLKSKIDAHEQAMSDFNQQHLNDQIKLDQARTQAENSFKKMSDNVNKSTSDYHNEQGTVARFDGNEKNAGDAVKSKIDEGITHESGVYDENLKEGSVKNDPINRELSNFEKKVRLAKPKLADAANYFSDRLKMSNIVNQDYESTPLTDEQKYQQLLANKKGTTSTPLPEGMIKALEDAKVNPKFWDGKSLEELKGENPPTTLEEFKLLKNSAYETMTRQSDEGTSPAIRQIYMDTVDKGFHEAFSDAIKEKYGNEQGKEVLATIEKTDANYSNLKNNPLSGKETINLSDINKNWKELVTSMSKVKGGDEIISRLQHFAAERILDGAETDRAGEYNPSKISKGLEKYSDIFKDSENGNQITQRLQTLIERNQNILDQKSARADEFNAQQKEMARAKTQKGITATLEKRGIVKEGEAKIKEATDRESAAKQTGKEKIEDITKKQNDLKDAQSKLEQAEKERQANFKAVGADKPDFVDNVGKINSPEKLADFVKKSGISVEDIGRVAVQKAYDDVAKEIGKNRLEVQLDTKGNPVLGRDGRPVLDFAKFDASDIGKVIDKIDKLGENSQEVQDRLLGQTKEMSDRGERSDLQKKIGQLEKKYEEWNKAKSSKAKTIAGRAANALLGGLIVTLSPYGKFFGIRKLVSSVTPEASSLEEIGATARTVGKGTLAKSALEGIAKVAPAGALAKVGEENDN